MLTGIAESKELWSGMMTSKPTIALTDVVLMALVKETGATYLNFYL